MSEKYLSEKDRSTLLGMEPVELFQWVERRNLSRNRVCYYYREYRKIHKLSMLVFRRYYLSYKQAIFRSDPVNKNGLQNYFNSHNYRTSPRVKSWTRVEVYNCLLQMRDRIPASMIAFNLKTTIHSIRYIGRKRRMGIKLLKINSVDDYNKKEKLLIDIVYSNTEDELRKRLGNN